MADNKKLDPNEVRLIERDGPPAPAGGPPPRPVAPPPHADDRSLGDLLSELASETTTLVKQEIALAKTEIREEVTAATNEAKTAAKNVGFIAAGGAVAYTGLIAIVIGLGWLLGEILGGAEWLGILLVGLIVAAVGYALVKKGLTTLRHELDALKNTDLTPERTIKTLKEDKEWLKHETP
jgi:hypothetical protein